MRNIEAAPGGGAVDGEGEAAGGDGEDREEVKGGPGRRGRSVIEGFGREWDRGEFFVDGSDRDAY